MGINTCLVSICVPLVQTNNCAIRRKKIKTVEYDFNGQKNRHRSKKNDEIGRKSFRPQREREKVNVRRTRGGDGKKDACAFVCSLRHTRRCDWLLSDHATRTRPLVTACATFDSHSSKKASDLMFKLRARLHSSIVIT